MENKRKPKIFIDPPRLKWDFIRAKAEEFRKSYVEPVDLVPIPIIDIVELKLGIVPIPIDGLLSKIDIDGFLTNDLKNICIDTRIYMDVRQINRLNFTYAHEVGHLILHENEIKQCDFRSSDDWMHFREDFLTDDLNWFESHAYEFAGRLLVPKEELEKQIRIHQEKINKYKALVDNGEEELIEAVSRMICQNFQVSNYVIQKRIRKEGIKL